MCLRSVFWIGPYPPMCLVPRAIHVIINLLTVVLPLLPKSWHPLRGKQRDNGPVGRPGKLPPPPPPGILADPPTHPNQKIFPGGENDVYHRGPNLEVEFRYTHCFLASDPRPRFCINQPLSKGLSATSIDRKSQSEGTVMLGVFPATASLHTFDPFHSWPLGRGRLDMWPGGQTSGPCVTFCRVPNPPPAPVSLSKGLVALSFNVLL